MKTNKLEYPWKQFNIMMNLHRREITLNLLDQYFEPIYKRWFKSVAENRKGSKKFEKDRDDTLAFLRVIKYIKLDIEKQVGKQK